MPVRVIEFFGPDTLCPTFPTFFLLKKVGHLGVTYCIAYIFTPKVLHFYTNFFSTKILFFSCSKVLLLYTKFFHTKILTFLHQNIYFCIRNFLISEHENVLIFVHENFWFLCRKNLIIYTNIFAFITIVLNQKIYFHYNNYVALLHFYINFSTIFYRKFEKINGCEKTIKNGAKRYTR